MKAGKILIFATALAVSLAVNGLNSDAAAASCSSVQLGAPFTKPINVANPDQALFSEAVRSYVNFERCRKGLPAVASDSRLVGAAAGHSVGMAHFGIFSHRIPRAGYVTFENRMVRAGVGKITSAENITKNYVYAINGRAISTRSGGPCTFFYAESGGQVPKHNYASLAREAVAQWMGSPGHRKNILNRRYAKTGAGFGVNTRTATCGDVYLTQIFTR